MTTNSDSNMISHRLIHPFAKKMYLQYTLQFKKIQWFTIIYLSHQLMKSKSGIIKLMLLISSSKIKEFLLVVRNFRSVNVVYVSMYDTRVVWWLFFVCSVRYSRVRYIGSYVKGQDKLSRYYNRSNCR